jgi:hypothetical protein
VRLLLKNVLIRVNQCANHPLACWRQFGNCQKSQIGQHRVHYDAGSRVAASMSAGTIGEHTIVKALAGPGAQRVFISLSTALIAEAGCIESHFIYLVELFGRA